MGQETSGLTILCGYGPGGTSNIPLGPCPDLAPTGLWVDPDQRPRFRLKISMIDSEQRD